METYLYRDYVIDFYPSAGGFKAFIYPPGGICSGFEETPIIVGPDGAEAVLRKRVLQESRRFVDRLIGRKPK